MKMKFVVNLVLTVFCLALFCGCAERAANTLPSGQPVVVAEAPPPARAEYLGNSPGPGYVWVPGYWAWEGHWVWITGFWRPPPRPFAVWVPGNWVKHDNGYVWVSGYWR